MRIIPPCSIPLEQLCSIEALALSLELRDPYTRDHCERVQRLCDRLAAHCALPEEQRAHLRVAARFHDIGKIGIPDDILFCPQPLDDAQRAIMRQHPVHGERLFAATGRPDAEQVARLIRHHHEAFDGSGYPDGLAGEQILLAARILTVADAYDAMTSDRPYRPAMTHARAMQILAAEQGKRIDPQVFAALGALLASNTEHTTQGIQASD